MAAQLDIMEPAQDTLAPRIRLLRLLGTAAGILNNVLLGVFLLLLLLRFAPYIKGATSIGLVRWLSGFDHKLAGLVRHYLPVRFAGHDLSHWMVIALTFGLSQLMSAIHERCSTQCAYLRFHRDYEIWKRENQLTDNAEVLSPLNQILEQLRTGKLKDRDELLKVFAETKRKLDKIARNLAFLSIDVVDSTGMKHGEEKAAVEHDFKEFKRYVEGHLHDHGCLKTAWTPDGAMGCFAALGNAIAAGRDIIDGLPTFNERIKTMQRDFAVRGGINAGYVYFEDATPLEEVSDHVIDVAGHLQKNAAPNTIAVWKTTLAPVSDPAAWAPLGKEVCGAEAYFWQPRASATSLSG